MMVTNFPDELAMLSLPRLAEELGVSRTTLWRYVQAGRLRARKVGNSYVVLRHDLERFTPPRRGRPRNAS
jgi:excisionase family DNA binding protein